MFERFISRLDPQELVPQGGRESLGAAGASQLELEGGVSDKNNYTIYPKRSIYCDFRFPAENKQTLHNQNCC